MTVAHGGAAGAIVEIAGVVVLVALVLAVWLRDRRQPDDVREAQPGEDA